MFTSQLVRFAPGFGGALLLACSAGPRAAQPASPATSTATTANVAEPAKASAEPADASDREEAAGASVAQEADSLELPTACADASAKVCTPSATLARNLCKKRSTELALAMFRKGSPWSRAYLRLNMEAWYTGSRLAAPSQLVLDEEVIVVESRTRSTGGIQMGGGSFDVLRWNGVCVSVMADEVTFAKPPVIRVAPIQWKRLTSETRDVLLKDASVRLRFEVQRQRCQADDEAPRCTEAVTELSQRIARFVRKGGEVPSPKLVMW